MGIVDKFKNLVNPVDNDEEYEGEDYSFDVPDSGDYGTGYEEEYVQPMMQQPQATRRPMQQPQQSSVALDGAALEVRVIYPERWENVNDIADHLINHHTVVLNLEKTANKELARRMIDFLMGVIYTISGDITKAGPNTWVLAPSNVSLAQDVAAQQRQNPNANMFDPNMI